MSSYRSELIPGWVWIALVVAVLVLSIVAFSMAGVPRNGSVVIGPSVKTANPADYVQKPPTPTPNVSVTPTTPSQQPTSPSEGTAPTPPTGMPQSIKFGGQTWNYSDGPMSIDVETTGEYSGDYILYRKQGARSPYDALYIESSPDSGKFYKYVPAE